MGLSPVFLLKGRSMKSWRTTALGILAGIGLILAQLKAVLDSDPATVFELEQFLAGLGALGVGWFARDNGVSSEEAGVKK